MVDSISLHRLSQLFNNESEIECTLYLRTNGKVKAK